MPGVQAQRLPFIRRFIDLDWGEVAGLFRGIEEDGTAVRFRPHPLDAAEAQRIAGHAGKDTYIGAWVVGSLVGYGMLRGWDAGYDIPSLGIYVAPEARGRGLAKAIGNRLHGVAQYRGADMVRLKVFPDNVAARRVYDQLGYEFDGTLERGELVGFCTFRPQNRAGGDRAVFSVAGAMP